MLVENLDVVIELGDAHGLLQRSAVELAKEVFLDLEEEVVNLILHLVNLVLHLVFATIDLDERSHEVFHSAEADVHIEGAVGVLRPNGVALGVVAVPDHLDILLEGAFGQQGNDGEGVGLGIVVLILQLEDVVHERVVTVDERLQHVVELVEDLVGKGLNFQELVVVLHVLQEAIAERLNAGSSDSILRNDAHFLAAHVVGPSGLQGVSLEHIVHVGIDSGSNIGSADTVAPVLHIGNDVLHRLEVEVEVGASVEQSSVVNCSLSLIEAVSALLAGLACAVPAKVDEVVALADVAQLDGRLLVLAVDEHELSAAEVAVGRIDSQIERTGIAFLAVLGEKHLSTRLGDGFLDILQDSAVVLDAVPVGIACIVTLRETGELHALIAGIAMIVGQNGGAGVNRQVDRTEHRIHGLVDDDTADVLSHSVLHLLLEALELLYGLGVSLDLLFDSGQTIFEVVQLLLDFLLEGIELVLEVAQTILNAVDTIISLIDETHHLDAEVVDLLVDDSDTVAKHLHIVIHLLQAVSQLLVAALQLVILILYVQNEVVDTNAVGLRAHLVLGSLRLNGSQTLAPTDDGGLDVGDTLGQILDVLLVLISQRIKSFDGFLVLLHAGLQVFDSLLVLLSQLKSLIGCSLDLSRERVEVVDLGSQVLNEVVVLEPKVEDFLQGLVAAGITHMLLQELNNLGLGEVVGLDEGHQITILRVNLSLGVVVAKFCIDLVELCLAILAALALQPAEVVDLALQIFHFGINDFAQLGILVGQHSLQVYDLFIVVVLTRNH